jgi:hypothetical protein
MLKEMLGKVSKWFKGLFKSKLCKCIEELTKRVEELEAINKRKEAARQKRYNYKQTKKQNA